MWWSTKFLELWGWRVRVLLSWTIECLIGILLSTSRLVWMNMVAARLIGRWSSDRGFGHNYLCCLWRNRQGSRSLDGNLLMRWTHFGAERLLIIFGNSDRVSVYTTSTNRKKRPYALFTIPWVHIWWSSLRVRISLWSQTSWTSRSFPGLPNLVPVIKTKNSI